MKQKLKSYNAQTYLAYALIAPAALYIVLIVAWPLLETIRLSFTNSSLAGEDYVGFENYQKIKKLNMTKKVVIGFGITDKTIKSLKIADGLVVGSAICKEITDSIKKRQNTVTNVIKVVKRLKNKIK